MPIKTTAQDAALEQIMELIQRKEIFPGARLFETDLEKSLGMSRTPIRGALDQLVVDGILEKKQNQRRKYWAVLSPPQLDRGMPLCSSAVSRCSSAFVIQFCFRGVGRFSKLLVYPSQFCFPAGLLEYPAICGGMYPLSLIHI